jgi:hypothetical protein
VRQCNKCKHFLDCTREEMANNEFWGGSEGRNQGPETNIKVETGWNRGAM